MTILDALKSRRAFGALPQFRDLGTWGAWLVFLRAFYGLPMDAADLAVFQKHTGRQTPRAGGYPEAVAITGRQSGKSAVAALVASFEATATKTSGTYALLVAQDERGVKRTLFGYAREPFREVPAFRREVVKETADAVELKSGAVMACYPCRPAAVRGVRASVVVVDELAFFRSTENIPVDVEMLRALRPTVATTGGRLLILSSPYGQSGALWDIHRQHFGNDQSAVLVWQASAPEMNPTLPADYLKRMEADDPEAYRSEVLGEFRAGLSTLFDPEALAAVTVTGRRELLPVEGTGYRAAFDASGGRSDAAGLAIGHRQGGRVVVDLVRRWAAPHSPAAVAAEAAGVVKAYGLHGITGDRFSAGFVVDAFRAAGVEYRVSDKTTSDNYLGLVPIVNAGAVELLDVPELLRELRGLERRRGTSGKDRVDHRPGAHDDVAAAVAGLVAGLGRNASDYFDTSGLGDDQAAPSPWLVPSHDADEVEHVGAVAESSEDAATRRSRGRGRWSV